MKFTKKQILCKIGSVLKSRLFIILAVYYVLLLIQHSLVYMYYDDYGYLSLSYRVGIPETIQGTDFSFLNLLQFLHAHYMGWGGRLLCFFTEIVFLKGGFWVFRIVQPFVIVLAAYFSFKLAKLYIRKNLNLLLALICSFYFLISIWVLRDSLYWATASFTYFWPLVIILPAIYFFIKQERTQKNSIWLIIFFFICGFTYEQTGVMPIAAGGVFIIVRFIQKKKIALNTLLPVLACVAGYLILVLAPGNFMRIELFPEWYYQPLTAERLATRFLTLAQILFTSDGGKYTSIAMAVSTILASVMLIRRSKIKQDNTKSATWKTAVKTINIAGLALGIFSTAYFSVRLFSGAVSAIDDPVCMLFFIFSSVFFVYYFIMKNQKLMVPLFLAGLASLGVLLVSPVIVFRSSTPALFVYFIVMGMIYCEFITGTRRKWLNLVYIAPLAMMMFFNYSTILRGYAINVPANEYNQQVLEQAQQQIKNNVSVTQITLHELKDDIYGNGMPYQWDKTFLAPWIKEYYDLPDYIQFTYEVSPEPVTWKEVTFEQFFGKP